jgi:hypothetical protein
MWFHAEAGAYRVGFTAFAVRMLQDVYFLDWGVEPGAVVKAKQEIGEIESSKAVSSLHAPSDGRILQFDWPKPIAKRGGICSRNKRPEGSGPANCRVRLFPPRQRFAQ